MSPLAKPFHAGWILVLAAVLLVNGCGNKTHREAAKQGWDLSVLHEQPVQEFTVTSHGVDQGSLRIETEHQMYQGREVIVQREYSKGLVTGMTETVFDAITFKPLYLQSYEDSAGRFREDRLEFEPGQVRMTRTESFFGGEDKSWTMPLTGDVFDESQLFTLFRVSSLEPGSEIDWQVFSRARRKVGAATVQVEAGTGEQLRVAIDLFGERSVVTLSTSEGYPVLEVEGPNGSGLQAIQ